MVQIYPYSLSILLFITMIVFIVIIIYVIRRNRSIRKRYQSLFENMRNEMEGLRSTMNDELRNSESVLSKFAEEKKKNAEKNNSQSKILALTASFENSVVIANLNGDLIWANKGFERLYGYTLGEYKLHVGKNIKNISTFEEIDNLLIKANETKKPQNYTTTIITKNGESKVVKSRIIPVYTPEGELNRFVLVDTDITEFSVENNKLKRLSLIVAKSSNVVLVYDKNRKLDWVNEAFKQIYNCDNTDFRLVFGENITDYFELYDKMDILKLIDEEKQEKVFVIPCNKASKDIRWKQVRVMPFFSDHDISYIVSETDISRIKEAEQRVVDENAKTERLLMNIFPEEIAEELKTKGKVTPMFYRSASVLFADITNFTALAERLTPVELVEILQKYFLQFDDVVAKHFVEKIKTIGDAYLCVGGIPMKNKSHPFDILLAGLELQKIVKILGKEQEDAGQAAWQLRIGIHTGPVVAGVVGKHKMAYDIWSDSVNIAKRIESACIPGFVNISGSTYEYIKDYFICEARGKILAKHKGHISMYLVHRLKPQFSDDKEGIVPNMYFRKMLAQL